jgi:hypothetical protein
MVTGRVSMLRVYVHFKANLKLVRSPTVLLNVLVHTHGVCCDWMKISNGIGVLLVNDQLDALFTMYLFPFSTCFEQPSAHHQENRIVSLRHLVYVTMCR